MSDTTTRGIRAEVESAFVPERSEAAARCFYFSYRVRITNVSTETARLPSREWIITDADPFTLAVPGSVN